jgi:hypothetical protein
MAAIEFPPMPSAFVAAVNYAVGGIVSDNHDWRHHTTVKTEEFWKAMDAYMKLRKVQGIGHHSPEGKAMAKAYEELKASQAFMKDQVWG